jgi:hypothetical protein
MSNFMSERKLLKQIESDVNSGKTHLGKVKGIFKNLLLFFADQEKFKTVKSLSEMLESTLDRTKSGEKKVVEQSAKQKVFYPNKHDRSRLPMVTISHWPCRKGSLSDVGNFYCNGVFNRKHKIIEKGFTRALLSFEDQEHAYVITMLFARDGEDGTSEKDHVYNVSPNRKGDHAFKIACTRFLNDYKLVERYRRLGENERGRPRNRFAVKEITPDQFYFVIPKSY